MHASWIRTAREFQQALLSVLASAACPGCGSPIESGFCPPCRSVLEWHSVAAGDGCGRCGRPRLGGHAGEACDGDHRPLRGLAWHVAPWSYAGTGGAVVRRAKFAADAAAMMQMSRSIAGLVGPRLEGPFRRALLVPVPAHRRKRRARGFDQAAQLARGVEEQLRRRWPALRSRVVEALVRDRATAPQGDPRVTDRSANVAGAFAARWWRPVRGECIVLVDDVLTSGSTLRECARVLRVAGARAVASATAARS